MTDSNERKQQCRNQGQGESHSLVARELVRQLPQLQRPSKHQGDGGWEPWSHSPRMGAGGYATSSFHAGGGTEERVAGVLDTHRRFPAPGLSHECSSVHSHTQSQTFLCSPRPYTWASSLTFHPLFSHFTFLMWFLSMHGNSVRCFEQSCIKL